MRLALLEMPSGSKKPKARMGALPARYSFALNPYTDARFTTCPRCNIKTRIRKIAFVIHVDGTGLLVLRKTCRLCVNCELVIVHKDELEPLIANSTGQTISTKPNYFVLGTVDPRTWRRGLSAGVKIDELIQHMADFKVYMSVEYTPGGWHRST